MIIVIDTEKRSVVVDGEKADIESMDISHAWDYSGISLKWWVYKRHGEGL